MNSVTIAQGLPKKWVDAAVVLYDEAFGAKFAVAIPDAEKRRAFLQQSLNPNQCFCAYNDDNLLGILGFKSGKTGFVGDVSLSSLYRLLGVWGSCRAGLVFSLYERKNKADILCLDGVAVTPESRGQGIGSCLIKRIIEYAINQRDYTAIRLDVIDTNPNAERLYKKIGFVAGKIEKFEFLRGLLGFGAATTMLYKLNSPS